MFYDKSDISKSIDKFHLICGMTRSSSSQIISFEVYFVNSFEKHKTFKFHCVGSDATIPMTTQ